VRRKATEKGTWHVGITTDVYFWLDMETDKLPLVISIAHDLADKLDTDMSVYPTTKSFWIVSWKPLPKNVWLNAYTYALERYPNAVCKAFCECCKRYGKATLRVDMKRGQLPRAKVADVLGRTTLDKLYGRRIPEIEARSIG
jgi:hypothetical protein